MATAFEIAPTEEKANRLRLLVLTFEGGTIVLKHIFDKRVSPSDLETFLRGKREKLQRSKKKHINRQQWDKLYPSFKVPSSEDFDITMLTFLLQHICDLDENSEWWQPKSVPPSSEISIEADISRLRYWRNEMCHPAKFSLKEEDFERKWKKTEEVLLRLGADLPNLQQEIQNLKKENIDPKSEKIYEEKIKELTEELAGMKRDKEKDSDKREMSSELQSLISMTKLHFEDFDQNRYVKTEVYKRAEAKFDASDCLVISGLPGEGKTSMAFKLIAEMDEIDCCLKLHDWMDWKHVTLQKKYTVFIDDIFGAGILDEQSLNGWQSVLPDIEKALHNKKIKLVITSRHYVMAEAKKELSRFNIIFDDKNVVDISSENLSNEEKTEILEKHLKNSYKQLDETQIKRCIITYNVAFTRLQIQYRENTDNNVDFCKVPIMIGFPEIVSLFASNDQIFCQGAAFFEKPVIFFKSCMEDLFRRRKHFLPLVVIWAKHQKGLNITELEPANISSELKEIAKLFGFKIKGKTHHLFRKSLKHHTDGFLRYSSKTGIYTFCHNIIKDMVGVVIGQENTSEVLQLASEQFVLQYVTTDEMKNDGLHVFVEECRYDELNKTICRLFREKEKHVLDLNDLGSLKQYFGHKNTQAFGRNKINANIVNHDCFENNSYLKIFVSSNEGIDILQEPVSVINGRFCHYGIHFGKQDIQLYLPSYALYFDNSKLLSIFMKDMFASKILNKEEFLNISLLIATHKGDKDAVEMILDRGAKINDDPIYIASINKNIDILTILLEHRDLNDSISSNIINENTPLIASVQRGNVVSVKCLVDHGVDVNYRNSKDVSALDKAIIYSQTEICGILLEKGANVHANGRKYKRKPLHIAADIGNVEIVSLLLQYGATIHAKDYRGHFAIHCAAIRGNIEVVDFLLREDLSQSSYRLKSFGKRSKIKGMDLMHLAVWKNNLPLIDLLLRNNVNPNVTDIFGRTPLYCAAYDGKIGIIKKLVVVSDVNKSEKNGYTPLHAAVYNDHLEIAKIICQFANVNAQDKYGKTPLHTACEKLNFRMFKFLCNNQNVDVRMCTKKGMTIFHTLIKSDRNINLKVSNFINSFIRTKSDDSNYDEECEIETFIYEVYQKDFKFVLEYFTTTDERQAIVCRQINVIDNTLNATYPPTSNRIQKRRLST